MSRASKLAAVRRSILVKAPREAVFATISEPEKLRQWYFDDADVDFRVGGTLSFSGMEGTVRATITAIEAPSLVVMDYSPPWWGTVTWQFEALSPASTRVHLLHKGFEGREDWIDRFAWGWESFLKSLKAVAEGRTPK